MRRFGGSPRSDLGTLGRRSAGYSQNRIAARWRTSSQALGDAISWTRDCAWRGGSPGHHVSLVRLRDGVTADWQHNAHWKDDAVVRAVPLQWCGNARTQKDLVKVVRAGEWDGRCL